VARVPAAGRLRALARVAVAVALACVFAAGALAAVRQDPPPPGTPPPQTATSPPDDFPPLTPAVGPSEPVYPSRPSRAVGQPYHGRLVGGVLLPAAGRDYVTWDWALKQSPNRAWRRWGTDKLVRTLLAVLRAHMEAFPGASPVVIADLSRPHGGEFGRRFGGRGHASHQNGLDVDVAYPREDGLPRPPIRVSQIDRERAQDLVDRFARADARYVFIGPHTHLRRPRRIVEPLVLHDNHMHVRIRPAPRGH
jgi:murein endopeptidase